MENAFKNFAIQDKFIFVTNTKLLLEYLNLKKIYLRSHIATNIMNLDNISFCNKYIVGLT